VKREEEVLDVDARLAECLTFAGEPDAALAMVADALVRARASKAGAKAIGVLERVRGHALLRKGDVAGARAALEASLAGARARRDLAETLLALHSLFAVHRRDGDPPAADLVSEYEALMARLKIRVMPPLPVS